jgi:NADH dehydrogenase FAD-containing subunit
MASSAVHNVVIIGASFGGIPVAHELLKNVFPTLGNKQHYKVILISPSAHFFWKIGSPRTIVNPAALPLEKVLLPIADGFKSYSAEQYEFLQAYVESIDPATKTVTTSTQASIHYDSLVIASGTKFSSPIWSLADGTEALTRSIKEIQEKLPAAKSVVVAGGGAAGVETSGELGDTYGGKKEITFLTGQAQPLARLANANVGKDAQGRLEKMGIKVVNNVRANSAKKTASGQTELVLDNGETMTVDVYIEATGDKPNNKFVPQAWLNEKGYVRTDGQTLRLEVPSVTGVYCIGSVASYSDGSVLDTKFSLPAIVESIKLDLQGQGWYSTSCQQALLTFPEPGPRTKKIYKKIQSDMQFVPIGKSQGVGVVFGYKIPSFMVKMAKSKDFMIGNAPKLVQGTG